MPYKPYLFYIETLDNPGWSLHVPMMAIEDTDYIREYPSDDIWFFQGIRQNEFSCAGDETKLIRIFLETLKYFDIPLTPDLEELIPLMDFLQTWYANECDEYWEHLYGVSMTVNKEHHCHIVIDLDETYWEDYYLKTMGSPDTFQCYTENSKFIGKGHLDHIKDFLELFKAWIEYCRQLED